jgi:Pretoxin HINT domain
MKLVAATLVAVVLGLAGCVVRAPCISEGTLVQTPSGETAIESLKVGDQVVTGDLDGRQGVGVVTAVLESRATRVERVTLDNGFELRCTTEHPIATPCGFRKAGQLRVGDDAVTTKGVSRVAAMESCEGSERVFDLAVEPFNTFFAAGVLVHNKTMPGPPRAANFAGRWIGWPLDHHWRSSVFTLDVDPKGEWTLKKREFDVWKATPPSDQEFAKRKRVTVTFVSPFDPADTVTMKMPIYLTRFRAELRFSTGWPDIELLFIREDELRRELGALR